VGRHVAQRIRSGFGNADQWFWLWVTRAILRKEIEMTLRMAMDIMGSKSAKQSPTRQRLILVETSKLQSETWG